MTLVGILLLILIAAICGAIAQLLVGYSAGGCATSSVLGVVGAFLGYWLADRFDLPLVFGINIQGQMFPVFWSIVGAVIVVAIASLLAGPRRAGY
ncbi:MAG: GlsB/YeaQ/YmgE family stress response membrane protein [Anaerolineae bacterium]